MVVKSVHFVDYVHRFSLAAAPSQSFNHDPDFVFCTVLLSCFPTYPSYCCFRVFFLFSHVSLLILLTRLWLKNLHYFFTNFVQSHLTGYSVMDVGGNTLIVWLFGKAVGPFMNALHLCFAVGALLAPLLTDRVVVTTGGIHWVYWILAGLAAPVIFWLSRFPSPEKPAQLNDDGEDGQPLQRHIALIVMISVLFFFHNGTELGFGSWIFSYAVAIDIGPETVARLLNSVYWGGFTLGRVIAIPLALKMKPKTMLLADLIGAVASITLMLLFPNWPASLWIGTFGLGLSIASMFPGSLNFAGGVCRSPGELPATS
jgi:FHS family Na+ dependent glucose MFS transporter 1